MNSSAAPVPAPPDNQLVELEEAIRRARSAAECTELAAQAEQSGAQELQRRALERAVALDRHNRAALLGMAALTLDAGDTVSTFAFLEEAARAGVLPAEVRPLHQELAQAAENDAACQDYLRVIGRTPREAAAEPRSIVLITNLFPPQELGGYGRMMWEFAHGLIARGHQVRVLTSDSPAFGKTPTPDEVALESHVLRSLELGGTWEGGRAVPIGDRREAARRARDNAARVRSAILKCEADLVLAGNLDFLGVSTVRPALERGVPVLHALANAHPGFSAGEQPRSPLYWVAPCSDWNGGVFRQAGFSPARLETLYPGARLDRFFRLFLPDTARLRICYASLVLPYKGADTLVQALRRLHAAGIDFSAEIAGDAPDAEFLRKLEALAQAGGFADRVRFTGFLDRDGLAGLFARSNVLVFPSRFDEPFGISQVEALAAGLVVVSSGTGGAKEIVRDGVDGLLFRAGDDADLAAKLARLASHPEMMARLQRAGQTRAAVFSVPAAVTKIEALAAEMSRAESQIAPPVDVSAEIAEARRCIAARDGRGAIERACAALRADSNCVEALLILGELALSRPEGAAEALKLFRQAHGLRPGDAAVGERLAAALVSQRQFQEAASVLDRLNEAQPGNVALSLLLARALEGLEQPAVAEATLREAIRLAPGAIEVVQALADLIKRRGRLDEALRWHRRAAGATELALPPLGAQPRHAVFLVQSGPVWSSVAPLYHAFVADPAWRVTVVALPFRHSFYRAEDERNEVFGFLEREGVPYTRWDGFDLRPGCADVAIAHVPYEDTLPPGWRRADLLRAVPRLVYVPYALVIVAGKENTAFQFNLPFQQSAWMVVAHSPRNRAMFTRHCATGDAHVVVTGHPKMDAVQCIAERDPELEQFAAGRKIVCWNPHFGIVPNGTPWGAGCSTFLRWQEFLLAEFARRPELAFVIRPHPLFFSSLEARKIWSAEEVAHFRRRVEEAGNIQLDLRPSYLPVFGASSALLSDASSLLLEYAVTRKPLLYLRNPHGPGLNDHGELIEGHCYTADDEAAIRAFLDQVARGDDPRAEARARALPEFITLPPGGAAAAVKAAVEARLAAESPVA